MSENLTFKIKVWRQSERDSAGKFVEYDVKDISADASFLEMLDLLNDELTHKGEDPVAFDYDCREGICGSCGCVIDGVAHGPLPGTTTCQLYMRNFPPGSTITVEPWRAAAFPVIKDLVVDRSALDRVITAGGYVSVSAGSAPDANEMPIPKPDADAAFEAAQCIGCGACVAACKNASASLFTGAKIDHLAHLPQGQAERTRRAQRMVETAEAEDFGACSNEGECEAVCPKEIPTRVIQRMNRDYVRAYLKMI
jgi:succinate dehydrogenase / fumarate reductase iron-sulfur subunit